MPTLAVGASYNQYLSVGMSVNIQNNHNVSGKIRFAPANPEAPATASRSFGPQAGNVTFGPWEYPGTVYIDCDAGSLGTLTYTINNEPAAPVAATTLSASSTVSGAGFSTYLASPPAIGGTTPGAIKTSNLQATYTDSSGTPGNVTNNSPRGRVALAAAASTVVVTNSLVAATSMIIAMVRSTDGAATDIVTATPAAGSFTITMNAATTGTGCVIDFLVVN